MLKEDRCVCVCEISVDQLCVKSDVYMSFLMWVVTCLGCIHSYGWKVFSNVF